MNEIRDGDVRLVLLAEKIKAAAVKLEFCVVQIRAAKDRKEFRALIILVAESRHEFFAVLRQLCEWFETFPTVEKGEMEIKERREGVVEGGGASICVVRELLKVRGS